MKTLRVGLGCMIGSLFAGSLSAQSVQNIVVLWEQGVVQTGANPSDVVVNPSEPYRFGTWIDGADNDPLSPNTFTANPVLGLPNGTTGPGLAPRGDLENGNGSEWHYKSPAYATLNDLTAAFAPNGANPYTMTLEGSLNNRGFTSPTTVTFPAIPDFSTSIVAMPFVTLTGGTWLMNGHYLLDSVDSALTISFNLPYNSAPGPHDSFHYGFGLHDSEFRQFIDGTDGVVNYDPLTGSSAATTIADVTIAAQQLIDGNTYTLEVGYAQVLAVGSALDSALMVALYSFSSQIIIDTPLAAVPEPATYGMLLGAVVLAGVLWARRRQAAG